MEKEKSKILVRDLHGQQTLFECPIQEAEKAWKFAAEMEEMGIEVEVISPTLSETLSTSLGLSAQQLAEYKQSMEEEIEHHDGGSCCFEKDDDTKIH
jgi:hypothetical protein